MKYEKLWDIGNEIDVNVSKMDVAMDSLRLVYNLLNNIGEDADPSDPLLSLGIMQRDLKMLDSTMCLVMDELGRGMEHFNAMSATLFDHGQTRLVEEVQQ